MARPATGSQKADPKKVDPKKKAAWRRGQRSETIAVAYLRLKGYRILARQYRTALGEIDIIARRGSFIVFVEVKARKYLSDAASSISPAQQSRIIRASTLYVQANPALSRCDLRFDAILLSPWRWPLHIVNAWQL